MFEHLILRSEPQDGRPDRITDGKKSWHTPQLALDELGAQGYELVSGYRNDYVEKLTTSGGLRHETVIERELLLKRQTNPAKSWMDRILKR